jgi:hypothetical protein
MNDSSATVNIMALVLFALDMYKLQNKIPRYNNLYFYSVQPLKHAKQVTISAV